MPPLPALTNFIRSGPYFIALKMSRSTIGFHCEQVALYIKHANHLAKGEIPSGWIEPVGYKIFTAAWNKEDAVPSGFPVRQGSTMEMLTDICITMEEIFPPLPIKCKAGLQGSREGTPPVPGGHVLTQDEYTTATRAVWEEASASHRQKDHIAEGKHVHMENRDKRSHWDINNVLSLHVPKPTFSLAPDKHLDTSNAIPEDALPGSGAMDTDGPGEKT
ncbi:hypothetical protein IW261DRAFT_1428708 [Armillaria novae-zelandiae]|uniref:Uncharacterized protein n=1 Tax=Armillaria novae-zelandiae TaxID=153914 RepID=A0AA39N876_9AGAR|nr:hypothetical protein IW261DRAFT_1428708 [Armillaria novae-zelandiae]